MEITAEDAKSTEEKDKEGEEETKEKKCELVECGASEHKDQFDGRAYLTSFYTSPEEDEAMTIVLFFLPGMLYRIPVGGTLLDLGAGPTVYLPITCRDRVDAIYTSDYSPSNRRELKRWWLEEPDHFNWSSICTWISSIEANQKTQTEIEKATRDKLRAILCVDVQQTPSIDHNATFPSDVSVPEHFDIVASIFCLEYSSENREGYGTAVRNACGLVKAGGYLLLGGILHMHNYYFAGRKFRSFYLTKADLLACLNDNDMHIDVGQNFKFICHDDIFLLVSRKK